ncbi:hypothetical protein TNCV_2229661 [Trichonephila clavipes]|uniref:Uncharacterized protein n=1 Tax=Trichonephila clavipes TaxID=2585209 RepID=A0A8X7BJ01_TRICX|nr:hypothetical protein TNCV_2229661 [Trichonephila clavipes]
MTKYRQCIREGSGSEIRYHPTPRYLVQDQQKRDSSVNTISFLSVVPVSRSSHHWWCKRLWLPVKDKRSNGRLADIPLCCKWRRMVRVNIDRCVTN